MKSFVYVAAGIAALAALVSADCPNACSGHGLCRDHDQCKCEPNYFGADCSQRVCPSDYAFTDIPAGDLNHDGKRDGNSYTKFGPVGVAKSYELFPTDKTQGLFQAAQDEAHFYVECSGKGACDRASGECKCEAGYTGSACQRTTCPNDCSGHGLCRTLQEIASGALTRHAVGGEAGNLKLAGVRAGFDYNLWDSDKHQMCICDAGFDGIDCSERTCPRGDDPLSPATERWCGGQACAYEVQQFTLSSAASSTYKATFTTLRNESLVAYFTVDTTGNAPGAVTDTTKELAGPTTNAGIIMNALRSIPGGVLQLVEVRAMDASNANPLSRNFQVTFTGIAGNQYMLQLEKTAGPGSVTAAPSEITAGNFEDIECSGRGVCDRSSGLCGCFSGYFGVACEYQNALTAGSAGATAGVVSA